MPFSLLHRLTLGWLLGCAVLTVGCKSSAPAPPVRPAPHPGTGAAYEHTRQILSHGPRPFGSEALANARQYVASQLEKCGWAVRQQTFQAPVPGRGQVTFVNLIARFGDSSDPSLWTRPVTGLLAAHLDSKFDAAGRFLGADDAASAVAVLLVLAEELQARPERARSLEVVFFDGEEAYGPQITRLDGLYGSKHYAKDWRTVSPRPSFGILLDMIGHKNLSIRFPSDSPSKLVRVLEKAARTEQATPHFRRARGPIIDDHVPLNDAGIPTIDLIGDFSSFDWWHTDADNLDLISMDSLDIILRVTSRMLETLLQEPDRRGRP